MCYSTIWRNAAGGERTIPLAAETQRGRPGASLPLLENSIFRFANTVPVRAAIAHHRARAIVTREAHRSKRTNERDITSILSQVVGAFEFQRVSDVGSWTDYQLMPQSSRQRNLMADIMRTILHPVNRLFSVDYL